METVQAENNQLKEQLKHNTPTPVSKGRDLKETDTSVQIEKELKKI